MIGRDVWKDVRILRLVVLLCGLTFHRETNANVDEIEKSIYDYYKKLDGLVWKWELPQASCTRLKSARKIEAEIVEGHVMLESQNCTRIPVQVLNCLFKDEVVLRGNEIVLEDGTAFEYVRGVNGEVYEVSPPKTATKCNDPTTPVIKRCVQTGQDVPVGFSEIKTLMCRSLELVESTPWDNLVPICDFLKPHAQLEVVEASVQEEEVFLESPDCTKFKMKFLKCAMEVGSLRRSRIRQTFIFIRGVLDNDVYAMSIRNDSSLIHKRVTDFNGKRTQPLCPT